MSGFFDVYSIIFLVIAVVIFVRLGSVLGRRTGNEPAPRQDQNFRRMPESGPNARPGMRNEPRNDNVVMLPTGRKDVAPADTLDLAALDRFGPGSAVHEGLVAVARASGRFDVDEFLVGARKAYEMIVMAFASGDRDTLKGLLAADVFQGFSAAINEREKQGHHTELSLIGVDQPEIKAASLEGRDTRISLLLTSHLVSVTRDAQGAVIEGDPDDVQIVRDLWTFSRDIRSRDPNWALSATESA
ncbi:Predicted lipid-binding transport protein, Tim44 family [Faunimonas pinastri]|uniref:Predicted lipid-binding transport protein, Tim44 family n=1 Tax=Faunimonas pinastri TaxID=1855383 RepID=A0A1H9GXF8_9HYPH|nr:Tim44/TimA family putative adaptor protein [Faunimonas pinastri]SEQ54727.1 Predicted lipid-binding transport protein, Tim44 family [Faunimonas pinastri]